MTPGEFRLTIHAHRELSDRDQRRLREGLDPLRRVVESFPVRELHLDIREHARANDFHVRASLRLPKQTLFTGERAKELYPAYERCVRKLIHKVGAYKDKLRGEPERSHIAAGTLRAVQPAVEPDAARLEESVSAGDFGRFRHAMSVYESSLADRVARAVNRFPELEGRLGTEIVISEIVEETFLNAFEHFGERPAKPLGSWLESWIVDSITLLLDDTDRAKRNLTLLNDASSV
ncbi:MAG: hypothetical protein KDC38_10390 [Planctomycetes bacterium]|nr:hypothetical protein [Planctomycetota bacterium]